MGNDGGRFDHRALFSYLTLTPHHSIPTRRELVKEAARNPSTTQLKETRNEQQQYHWTTCPLSHKPLCAPIVSDSAGQLYSKAAVLETLLEAGMESIEGDERGAEDGFRARVKGLRDIVEVRFQVEDQTESKPSGGSGALKWVCPITKKRLGPGVKAVYLVPCGHAFLESVVKEMPEENCLQVLVEQSASKMIAKFMQCNEAYTPENIIPILPFSSTENERLAVRAQNLKKQGLTHSLKKASGSGKKRKKNAASAEPVISGGMQDSLNTTIQAGRTLAVPQGSIRNEGTAALTARVLAEEKDRNKKRKLDTNENLKSLFSSKNGMEEKQVDFMTRGFSIPAGAKR